MELDRIRQGLSYKQEVAMLVRVGLAGEGEQPAGLSWTPEQRRNAEEQLRLDLIEDPLIVPMHMDWRRQLEEKLGFLPPSGGPCERISAWVALDMPPLSGRLRRVVEPELASYILLEPTERARVQEAYSLKCLSLLRQHQTRRERALTTALLTPDLLVKLNQHVSGYTELNERALRLLAHALEYTGRKSPRSGRFWLRWRNLLTSFCFSQRYSAEVYTLAHSTNRREGRRFLRYNRKWRIEEALSAPYRELLVTSLQGSARPR